MPGHNRFDYNLLLRGNFVFHQPKTVNRKVFFVCFVGSGVFFLRIVFVRYEISRYDLCGVITAWLPFIESKLFKLPLHPLYWLFDLFHFLNWFLLFHSHLTGSILSYFWRIHKNFVGTENLLIFSTYNRNNIGWMRKLRRICENTKKKSRTNKQTGADYIFHDCVRLYY